MNQPVTTTGPNASTGVPVNIQPQDVAGMVDDAGNPFNPTNRPAGRGRRTKKNMRKTKKAMRKTKKAMRKSKKHY